MPRRLTVCAKVLSGQVVAIDCTVPGAEGKRRVSACQAGSGAGKGSDWIETDSGAIGSVFAAPHRHVWSMAIAGDRERLG